VESMIGLYVILVAALVLISGLKVFKNTNAP